MFDKTDARIYRQNIYRFILCCIFGPVNLKNASFALVEDEKVSFVVLSAGGCCQSQLSVGDEEGGSAIEYFGNFHLCASRILGRIISAVPQATKLLEFCNNLLPLITKVFGFY